MDNEFLIVAIINGLLMALTRYLIIRNKPMKVILGVYFLQLIFLGYLINLTFFK